MKRSVIDYLSDVQSFKISCLVLYMYMQLFGSYQRRGSSLAEEESVESASWRDGILTRVIKQMECVENMKMKIKHPDSDSTMNNVSVHSNVDDLCFFFC